MQITDHDSIDLLENAVMRKYAKDIDPEVFRLLYRESSAVEQIEKITAHLDIDNEVTCFLSMLAQIGMHNGFEGFREDLVPKLRGTYSFHQVKTAMRMQIYRQLMGALSESGVDWICGYYLSLNTRYITGLYRNRTRFDVVVHSEDADRVNGIIRQFGMRYPADVFPCDLQYVWEHTRTVEFHHLPVATLSPCSMLALWASEIRPRLFGPHTGDGLVISERMYWLNEYKTISLDDEQIDSDVLHGITESSRLSDLRFILSFAYFFFNQKNKYEELHKTIPADETYLDLLRTAYDEEK